MKTILLIEDEVQLLTLMREVLEEEGYHVLALGTGQEALQIVDEHQPDLILSDIMLPMMSGTELCRRLKVHPRHHHIPIVLMSAVNNKPDQETFMYDAFLPKPFDINNLFSIVQQLLLQT